LKTIAELGPKVEVNLQNRAEASQQLKQLESTLTKVDSRISELRQVVKHTITVNKVTTVDQIAMKQSVNALITDLGSRRDLLVKSEKIAGKIDKDVNARVQAVKDRMDTMSTSLHALQTTVTLAAADQKQSEALLKAKQDAAKKLANTVKVLDREAKKATLHDQQLARELAAEIAAKTRAQRDADERVRVLQHDLAERAKMLDRVKKHMQRLRGELRKEKQGAAGAASIKRELRQYMAQLSPEEAQKIRALRAQLKKEKVDAVRVQLQNKAIVSEYKLQVKHVCLLCDVPFTCQPPLFSHVRFDLSSPGQGRAERSRQAQSCLVD
jgi:Cu/Ag efflux protein CusF